MISSIAEVDDLLRTINLLDYKGLGYLGLNRLAGKTCRHDSDELSIMRRLDDDDDMMMEVKTWVE